LQIVEINSKRDIKKFAKFPLKLYKDNEYYVPAILMDEINTFLPEKNPAFEYCRTKFWLAVKDGEIVGRIAGIINDRYIEKWKNKYARFGWLDFIDDAEVSSGLIKAVEDWAKSEGMTAIHGPLGFTDMDYEGMLVEGFNELSTLATIYNYPYYPEHLEKYGYVKDTDWVEFEIKVPEKIPEIAEKISKLVQERKKVRVFQAKKSKDLLPYAHGLFKVLNDAFSGLYGFVELTPKQIDKYVKQYFSFIKTDYLKLLLDENNEVAGFLIAMPSLSRALQKSRGKLFPFGFIHLLKAMNKNKYIDLYLGAIRPDLQGKGADALLITEITRTAIKNKIISAESNIELESNYLVQSHWKHFDVRQHKRRRCYIKQLTDTKKSQ
jgi:hypothetical protein